MFDINKLDVDRIEYRLSRLRQELSHYDSVGIINNRYTAHGGWSIGYIEGQIRALEDLLDYILYK